MKKLLVFMFLLSSVSFVGCAQKSEAPVDEPTMEEAAPAADHAADEAGEAMEEHSEEAAH
ncbi:MAG TPA: hypothetical protein ENL07_03765 [Chlorobaculum parvum]|uniref:Lipoprotein n=1 Tax=Chlorobaculum parvum TaxID=274539 RepID=A0A7C5DJY9_9CHLB|nr:hypothetical protein [Chlorobaculum parvum]